MLDQFELWRPFYWHCLNILQALCFSKPHSEATRTTEIWHTHTDHFRLLLITIVSSLLNRPLKVVSVHVASRRSMHPLRLLLHRIEVIRRWASNSKVNQWTPIIRDPTFYIQLLLHLVLWVTFPAKHIYELTILSSRDRWHVQAFKEKLMFRVFAVDILSLMTLTLLVMSFNIRALMLVMLW